MHRFIPIFAFLSVPLVSVLLAVDCAAQNTRSSTDPKIVNTGKLVVPEEARKTGLGGKITIKVQIDQTGNVTKVGEVYGPDFICPMIQRPDVRALRDAARKAAADSKFEPATKNGNPIKTTAFLTVTFPSEKKEGGSKDRNFQAVDNTMPVDLEGDAPRIVKSGIVNGKALSLPRPSYPAEARAARVSGTVQVQVLILEDGSVFSAEPRSGHPVLHGTVRQAACAAKFTPTILEGNSVKVSGIITYNFIAR